MLAALTLTSVGAAPSPDKAMSAMSAEELSDMTVQFNTIKAQDAGQRFQQFLPCAFSSL